MIGRRMQVWLGAAVLLILAPAATEAQSSGPDNPYVPPPCAGNVFADVTCTTPFDPWIEQYAADEITGGCGGGLYCPGNPVTRAQMAVFVEKAMRGTAAWSPGDLGYLNTGLGRHALISNTTGMHNTAVGGDALGSQSFDNGGSLWFADNTAVGWSALALNQPTATSNGALNTAVGSQALSNNVIGHSNTAVGYNSLVTSKGFDNTAIGSTAGARTEAITGYAGSSVQLQRLQTGNYNTFVGIAGATAQVDNCTAVGMDAYCDATNQIRLGNFFVTSIGGKVAWSTLSDARAKQDVRDLDHGLALVLALRPVSYRYKDGNGRTDMGFVAQDVEAVLGDGYNVVDAGGDADRTLSLRYAELIAPLVRAIQEQQALIEAQRRENDRQSRKIEALEAGLTEVDTLRMQIERLMESASLRASGAPVRAERGTQGGNR